MKLSIRATLGIIVSALLVSSTYGQSVINYGITDSSSSGNGHWDIQFGTTLNQSGTAGYTDILVNRTETSLGTGNQYFQDWQVAGVSQAHLDHAGNFNGRTFTSTVASGTAPLVVSSTTNVPNLNASSLNGATFAAPGVIGGSVAGAGTFTQLNGGQLAGLRNRVINGACAIDQRHGGTAVTSDGYLIDRLYLSLNSAASWTAQQSTDAPVGFTNSAMASVTTGASPGAGDLVKFDWELEGQTLADFAFGTGSAQSFTISFWVKASSAGTYSMFLRNSAGDRIQTLTYTINSAATWEHKTVTLAGDTSGTWLNNNGMGIQFSFVMSAGSTFTGAAVTSWSNSSLRNVTGSVDVGSGTGNYFGITGVQFELGTNASPFETRPYGLELLLCQRYCYAWTSAPNNYYNIVGLGLTDTVDRGECSFTFPQTMRVVPTLTASGTFDISNGTTKVQSSIVSLSSLQQTLNTARILFSLSAGSGINPGAPLSVTSYNTTPCRLVFNADF